MFLLPGTNTRILNTNHSPWNPLLWPCIDIHTSRLIQIFVLVFTSELKTHKAKLKTSRELRVIATATLKQEQVETEATAWLLIAQALAAGSGLHALSSNTSLGSWLA